MPVVLHLVPQTNWQSLQDAAVLLQSESDLLTLPNAVPSSLSQMLPVDTHTSCYANRAAASDLMHHMEHSLVVVDQTCICFSLAAT